MTHPPSHPLRRGMPGLDDVTATGGAAAGRGALLRVFLATLAALALLVAAAIAIAADGAAQAVAAAEAGTVVDVSVLLEWGLDAAFTLLAVGGLWLIRRGLTWLGLQNDEHVRSALENGFMNALSFGRERVAAHAEDRQLSKVDLRNAVIAEAARYLLPKLPDSLRHFRIDEAGLKERLLAWYEATAPRPPALAAPGETRDEETGR